MAVDILKIGTTEDKRKNELDSVVYKQIDKWDFINKTFTLKCNYPCSNCKDDDPDFCLTCWGDLSSGSFTNLNFYLQPRGT
jgi:hypothetical protein